MFERKHGEKGWLAISLLAAYACAGRSLGPDDGGGEAGAANASFAGRGGSGGTSSPRGGNGGTNPGKGGVGGSTGGVTGSGAFAGTLGLDGGSAGRGGSAGTVGGAGGSAGAPEPIGGWGGEAGPSIGGAFSFECLNPRAVDGGYVACASTKQLPTSARPYHEEPYGYLHRPARGLCPLPAEVSRRSLAEGGAAGHAEDRLASSGAPSNDCSGDGDCDAYEVCSDRERNSCANGDGDFTCQGVCESDSDCGTNAVCLCGGLLTIPQPGGVCVPATCRSDAECGPGLLCASSFYAGYALRFDCQSPADECASRDHCDSEGGSGGLDGDECVYGSTGRFCDVLECGFGQGGVPGMNGNGGEAG